ncbi:hypothetical protein GGR56DRAFT_651068 [Xylariaceae sp. FL0804]|nr:hypothetical protein GGR56DRAFT_651068 [Xylariaceae sp. FL0804]
MSTSTSSSSSSPAPPPTPPPPPPPTLNYILGFLLVGLAWGLTTPFIRRAARERERRRPTPHPLLEQPSVRDSWLRRTVCGAFFAVADLLRDPRYAVPLLVNLTGSVWFFLLVGQAELSLTVPIVNTLAFLFTVLGDWWVDQKVISRGKPSPPCVYVYMYVYVCVCVCVAW